MATSVSLALLENQIKKLTAELDKAVGNNYGNLTSPEVLEINRKIDILFVSYIKLTI